MKLLSYVRETCAQKTRKYYASVAGIKESKSKREYEFYIIINFRIDYECTDSKSVSTTYCCYTSYCS